jgi:hypothetical protein
MRRVFLGTLLILGLAALAGLGSAGAQAEGLGCGAGANGSKGYAYAGHQSTAVAHGIRATITPTAAANVVAGHVAGWVGVGGPGQGANGQTMWLQVGVASIPDTPTMVYAEITRPGRDPQFIQLVQNVRVGESHKLAVLEIAGRSNWWRVWLDGKPATDPILLAGSSNRWRPIATGESWNGGESVCNRFAFRFDGVAVAGSAGGAWQPFTPGYLFQDRGFGVKQLSPSGARTLSGRAPTPYAFEASSL